MIDPKMFFDLKIFSLSPCPLSHKGRGELVLFENLLERKCFKRIFFLLRTSICSLSLDGRGLGRGCFA
jgi:hypothetical protein